jgi:hypothetical protein
MAEFGDRERAVKMEESRTNTPVNFIRFKLSVSFYKIVKPEIYPPSLSKNVRMKMCKDS